MLNAIRNKFISPYKINNEFWYLLISFAVGILFVLLLCPTLFKHFYCLEGVIRSDQPTSIIGLAYYLQDSWHWPITVTKNLMYPVGTSVVYTDSWPLLCIILKILRVKPFVLHSIALPLNVSLIFYFSGLLLRRLGCAALYSCIAALFFVFAGDFIYCMVFSMIALSAHWIIIATLIPAMSNENNYPRAMILLDILMFFSIGTHIYLSSMVFPIILAYMAQSIIEKRVSLFVATRDFIILTVLCVFLLYFFGYFENDPSPTIAGIQYGMRSRRIFDFFCPLYGGRLKGHPGMFWIILLFISLVWLRIPKFSNLKKYAPLVIVLIAMAIYSLGNKIKISENLIFCYEVPECLSKVFNSFRQNYRYITPLMYSLFAFLIMQIYKFKRLRYFIVTAVLFVHLYEYQRHLKIINSRYRVIKYKSCFRDNFWRDIGKKYKHIYCVMGEEIKKCNKSFVYTFGYLAISNGMTMNDMYLSRYAKKNNEYLEKTTCDFMNGRLLPDTLYIVPDNMFDKRAKKLNEEQCREIDGRHVCADKL